MKRVQSRRASPIVQFQAKTFSRKTQVKVKWSIHSSCSYPFRAVTLKTNFGDEFKVNGQRLKHYLGGRPNEEQFQV